MNLLLAIFSCHSYEYTLAGMQDWFTRPVYDRLSGLRDSWLKDVSCDYKIFKGRRNGIHDTALRLPTDEVFLNCIDDYHHSSDKIRAVIRYTLDHDYTHLLKIDDDVYAYWDRVMSAGPVGDYSGGGGGRFHGGDYCAGFTYWLTRKSMEVIARSPEASWAEDVHVGRTLYKNGIRCNFDDRYYIAPFTKTNQFISEEELALPNDHLTIHSLTPEQMRRHYASGYGRRNAP